MSNPPPGVGTAYFPPADVTPNGHVPVAGPDTGRLRGLPRRRRPAMIALAVAMAGAGVLISAAVYQRADHQVAVVMVTRSVPAGSVIGAADLGTARVAVGGGIQVIPASQLRAVSGEIAAVALRPATLLAPADLTTAQPPGPGQVLVPAAIKPSVLPASGLSAGDQVLILATPGNQGEPSSQSGTPSLTAPVPAVVEAVNAAPDQGGFDVVDLLVRSASGPAVAAQVSTGQFALVVTKRSS